MKDWLNTEDRRIVEKVRQENGVVDSYITELEDKVGGVEVENPEQYFIEEML